MHSVILLEDGSIYTCGINEKGTAPAEGVEAEGSSDHLAPIIFANLISQHGKVKPLIISRNLIILVILKIP